MDCKASGWERFKHWFKFVFLYKIKRFFTFKKEKSPYILWVEREAKFARDHELENAEKDDAMLHYALACIDSAVKLAKVFDKQDHSGMSASITLRLFKKLAKWEPLTQITGEESEWGEVYSHGDGKTYQQNTRNTRLFREKNSDGSYSYKYTDILVVINDDEVWQTYPPVDEPGTLDDTDPRVKKYFDQRKGLCKKHNDEITMPFIPTTHYYTWDFETENLVIDKISLNKKE